MEKAQDRLDVLKKIEDNENAGTFDVDVEVDPPELELKPNKVDYFRRKLSSKIKTKVAYFIARKFLNKIIEMGALRVKDIKGIENWANLKTGAIITCNHFNPMDSFAMQMCYDASKHKKRKMFKVIKEGNYTNPPPEPKLFGFLMQNAYTLPLSSNRETMRKFLNAVDKLLQKGHFILIYPEQSMWWNYRKPKPLKKTAFKFAASNNVPVLPIFITMKDSKDIGPDGFAIQEYTINVGKPIYKDESLGLADAVEKMKQENFRLWKKIYEKTYKCKLEYTTEKGKLPKDVLSILEEE